MATPQRRASKIAGRRNGRRLVDAAGQQYGVTEAVTMTTSADAALPYLPSPSNARPRNMLDFSRHYGNRTLPYASYCGIGHIIGMC